MTAAGYSGGYGCHDQGKNNDTPGAWRCSQLEAKSTLRGTMVCPLHGGGYADHRRAPPPPPPQLAAVARRRCRSRNAVVSQPHEQHQATRNGPPDAYCRATEAFTNDGCYPTNERAFPLGYGWVEPGKGWTRSHRPIRCRVPHDAPKKIKKLATLGKDTSRDWFNVPSAQDTEWAISYLSREDGMQRHQKARRKAAREHAGHRGCHHAPKMVPPRGSDGSSASPRPSATCLAETQIMHHVSVYVFVGLVLKT